MARLFPYNHESTTRFIITIVLILTSIQQVIAQAQPLDSVMNILNRNDIAQLREIVKNHDVNDLNKSDQALYFLATGGIKCAIDDFENAYKDLQKAKNHSDDKRVIFMANDYMMELSNSASELQVAPESLMIENLSIATELNDPTLLIKSKFYFMFKEIQLGNYAQAQDICYEMRNISIENDLKQELIDTEFNLGTLHYYQAQNDSALFYYQKNLADVIAKKDTFDIAVRLNNLAMLQMAIGENQAAVDNLIEAKELIKNKNDKELSVGLLRNIADAQTAAGNYKEAIDYYNQFISEEDSLERSDIAQNLKELQTKYETAEKDLENAELTAKNLTSKNKIYLLLFILACITGIGAYLFNRMRQKQKLLAAQAEAQKQREEKLLRDQELAGIDAMITGQEKERKKIAQDLHDDIGSSLTTARMCIENVIGKSNQVENKKILENAYDLLNETYTKVRNISHAQKSSVLSSHGLIGTLEQLASRINAGKSIQVEVIHHGLQGNLSNSMELGLFRIIQELLNNTIKHAEAQNASIILTGYEDHVSIMVEDDGNGFIPENLNNNGTGLDSINTRVQNLDGTMEIDTKLKRGTTINIEIPLV
ncbi:sensor histidine kinase [Nonlabens ulvanivorans]|uniref:sensor histidine kinase n=1 Tax=Nonlabens ulvanivorans TaxID=906888 RepID=UPI002941CA55|nr:sensor histidine kinase [Nonlabens ulvanivorans]WOI23835.1 sensor histidine kinase [Nonlabens ulvanivorans]